MWQSEVSAGTNWTVLTQADTNAVGGVVWLAVGALVFVYFLLTGRSRELTIGEGA